MSGLLGENMMEDNMKKKELPICMIFVLCCTTEIEETL